MLKHPIWLQVTTAPKDTEAAPFQLQTISTSNCSFPSEDLSSKLINLGTRTTFLALGKNPPMVELLGQISRLRRVLTRGEQAQTGSFTPSRAPFTEQSGRLVIRKARVALSCFGANSYHPP